MLISITAKSIRGAANSGLRIALLAVSTPVWREPSLIPCSEMVVDDFREIKVPGLSLKAL